MARFRYQAATADGKVLEGEMEAVMSSTVIERLRADGHIPIRVDERTPRHAFAALANFEINLVESRAIGLPLLTRELATLLHAGLPLDRSLAVLDRSSTRQKDKAFVEQLQGSIRAGSALAKALEAFRAELPNYYIGMVRAGETGGNLDAVLERLADTLDKSARLRETVRSALYYPIFVLLMTALSLVILITVVVPEFRPLFEGSGATMPFTMRVITAIGDIVRDYWWALIVGCIAVVLMIRRMLSGEAARLWWHRQIVRAPILGELCTKIEVARFSRTLGTLLKSGAPLPNALQIAIESIGNRVIAGALDPVPVAVRRGEGVAIDLPPVFWTTDSWRILI